jgi:Spy/CpxP family protein refolding chaperone
MSKYLNRISQSADETKKSQAVMEEAYAKASVEQRISSLKAQAVTLSAAYEQALGATPFNVDKIVSLTAEIEQNKQTLKLVESILQTEF